jgi:hypothetical protein
MKLLKSLSIGCILITICLMSLTIASDFRKEVHLADVEARIDKALEKEEEMKDNVAYREVLKAMLGGQPEQKEEPKDVPKPKPVEQKFLNSQLLKLLNFLNLESNQSLSYLQENENKKKTGLGWVFNDVKTYVKNIKKEDERVFRHLLDIFETVNNYPKVMNYHLQDNAEEGRKLNLDQKEENNNLENKKVENAIKNYWSENRDYEIVINETDDIRNTLKLFINSLPEYLTDEDIKKISHNYIGILERFIKKEEAKLTENAIPRFSEDLAAVKNKLELGSKLTLEQLEGVLNLLQYKLDSNIDFFTTNDGHFELKNGLKQIDWLLFKIRTIVNEQFNLRKPLQNDFNDFVNVVKKQVLSLESMVNLDEEGRTKVNEKLKEQIEKEFQGVEKEKILQLTKKFSENALDILNKKLGESLSQENLNNVVMKLASAGIQDLEGLKDPNKKSDFIYDVNNIDKVMKTVAEEIKMLHEKNGKIKFRIGLKEFDGFINEIKEVIKNDLKFEKLANEKDPELLAKGIIESKNYLEKFEDDLYNVFTHENTKNAIKNYAKSFLTQFQKFYEKNEGTLKKSKLIQTFSDYIHDNPQQSVDNTPHRVLTSLIQSEMENSKHLSLTDKKCLQYLRHLTMRWFLNYHNEVDYAHLFKKENLNLLDTVYHRALYIGPDLDELHQGNNKHLHAHFLNKSHLDESSLIEMGKHFLEKNKQNSSHVKEIFHEMENDLGQILSHSGFDEHMKEFSDFVETSHLYMKDQKDY